MLEHSRAKNKSLVCSDGSDVFVEEIEELAGLKFDRSWLHGAQKEHFLWCGFHEEHCSH